MALTQGSKCLPAEIQDLKARVKAEMKRRSLGSNPLNGYGESTFDFQTTPARGGELLSEQIQKVIIPMNAIKETGIGTNVGDMVKALDTVSAL